ncbi:MAG: bifunctional fucokinase/L-fucose-1-P-guanylyltransferase, partial [Bacteroidetes bacterium]|nr:bifunctional fucokinase/L-fucose-1-P-guanylyltransferase [Bacteroidota bacterium]
SVPDPEVQALSCAVVPLPKGEFYHFGTSAELIESSLELQNCIQDQREILHRYIKPQPNLFVLNSETDQSFEKGEEYIWIENSHIPASWKLNQKHLITGIPTNNWNLELSKGICLDIVPVGKAAICIRPYGFEDAFRGEIGAQNTLWMEKSISSWLEKRNMSFTDASLNPQTDLQQATIFPVIANEDLSEGFIKWIISENPEESKEYKQLWLAHRLSAEEISSQANLQRLYFQRERFRQDALPKLAENARRSIFYQLDLDELAQEYADSGFPLPRELNHAESTPMRLIHDSMFRAEVLRIKNNTSWQNYERRAFHQLQHFLTESARNNPVNPLRAVVPDQVVWSRSPARIDLAGGWTDTPPYCLIYGGRVVNMAIELNGRAPIQAYVKPMKEPEIIIRSVDLSYEERITSYEELATYHQLGAALAIPKAALALVGFLPDFAEFPQKTLREQLQQAGGGIELTLMTAIPKGSGLGTSSILAATILGALSKFFNLGWNHIEIGNRTLILEQMLTSGGGWQDQYGGILPGIKMIETLPGFDQKPDVKWLPSMVFRNPEEKASMLLYYTGITRVANHILSEIVRGMFLNSGKRLNILHKLFYHTKNFGEMVQRGNYHEIGAMVDKTWRLNQALDSGTNPPEIAKMMSLIEDYLVGGKLPGAGGGGYLFLMAKDPKAALKIQELLMRNAPNPRARFVDFSLSETGMEVSGS